MALLFTTSFRKQKSEGKKKVKNPGFSSTSGCVYIAFKKKKKKVDFDQIKVFNSFRMHDDTSLIITENMLT